ncbi:MAG: Glu-tRNA(Gln) amidotransferase subunit GatD [Thermoplasmata archaeon]|nr:Glu-tRNA(Gln) amidotransferase subunit GatD [Thermoplasmata archaeon]
MGTTVELAGADGRTWQGTLVPSHELSGERIVQLKLDSGYNVGIRVHPADRLVVLERPARANGEPSASGASPAPEILPGHVALLTTGGTIASRVDYRTGGVRPVREESEILSFYPDLSRDGPVHVIPVFDRLSEEISPPDWATLAAHVAEAFRRGAHGVVIAHGTDTLAFTSAALAFQLRRLPGPVVLVGAQRSPDRPSSDGPGNLQAAVRLARHTTLGEVVVLMHAGLSDDRYAIHRGTRVRKMHSSRRDAFQSRNGPPLGWVGAEGVVLDQPYRSAEAGEVTVEPLESRGGILWSFPGLDAASAARFVEPLRGVVLAGTGLGHVSSIHLPWIREAVKRGVVVAMTTQCLEGPADPFVYATGRELLRAGVLYLDDLLPETAYAKMLWALAASTDPVEVRRLMKLDLAGEFSPRHSVGGPA